jgi:hypothetical protein
MAVTEFKLIHEDVIMISALTVLFVKLLKISLFGVKQQSLTQGVLKRDPDRHKLEFYYLI